MIPKKKFGRTGHESSRTIFGAFALSEADERLTDEIMQTVMQYGLNHIDVAASYGKAEKNLGPWMQKYRKQFFLATKTEERTYKKAKEELYKSLDLLKTDCIDLWQMHNLVNPVQWETAFAKGGAIEAFVEAKEQGLVRFLGVTGHGLAAPKMHLKSLNTYDFDSVLLPYNYLLMQNPGYAADFDKLQEKCISDNVAMQTIKSLAQGQLNGNPAKHNVWYSPLDNPIAVDRAVRWVLGNEHVFLNTSGDFKLLKLILQSTENLGSKPDNSEMDEMIQENNITPLFTGDEI